MRVVILERGEWVIAVVPEHVSGPGWGNRPLWVHIAGNQGKTLRTLCVQPEEQTGAMHALFDPGAAMAKALIESIPTKEKA